MPTLDKNDPKYPVRMDGVKLMKNGLATVIAGSLQVLTEPHETVELKALMATMETTFPGILPALTPSSRKETLIRLRSFQKDPKMQHLQPELASLVEVAEKCADVGPSP